MESSSLENWRPKQVIPRGDLTGSNLIALSSNPIAPPPVAEQTGGLRAEAGGVYSVLVTVMETSMPSNPPETAPYASSPCLAHELELTENGYVVRDRDAEADVARWRRAERARLVTLRLEHSAEERSRAADAVAMALDRLVDVQRGAVISVYWPIKGELDLRAWMTRRHETGARIALPRVDAMGQPLTFVEWSPDARLERGVWNIPTPVDGALLEPEIVIAPVVGFDRAGFRLGYGGGFFDRTLAAATPRPFAIGVGLDCAAIPTIYPQPHDIAMNKIITPGTAA